MIQRRSIVRGAAALVLLFTRVSSGEFGWCDPICQMNQSSLLAFHREDRSGWVMPILTMPGVRLHTWMHDDPSRKQGKDSQSAGIRMLPSANVPLVR
jgi:hypothetical protein